MKKYSNFQEHRKHCSSDFIRILLSASHLLVIKQSVGTVTIKIMYSPDQV